jgi:Nucleoside-diphosphate-sugar epimerases
LFFELNNRGNHYRDFTYIKDVIKILIKLLKIENFKYDIYNICSSKPIFIKKIINRFCKITGYKLIKNIKKNKLDVYKTYGDNRRIKKLTSLSLNTDFNKGLLNTIKWYNKIGFKYF